ncbi:hypothetical protein ACFX2G_025519 [Malus domestica]
MKAGHEIHTSDATPAQDPKRCQSLKISKLKSSSPLPSRRPLENDTDGKSPPSFSSSRLRRRPPLASVVSLLLSPSLWNRSIFSKRINRSEMVFRALLSEN